MSDHEYFSQDEDTDDYHYYNIKLLHSSESKSKRKNFTNYYFPDGREFIQDIKP